MTYILPILALALGLTGGALVARRRALVVLGAALVVDLLVFVAALWWGSLQPGWDGMGLAGFAWMICLPVFFGLIVGGALGWRRRRRAERMRFR
ncbi:hypothetical protein [Wenxinia marina]|uniref:Uncharacterized protein n=1 Tax=Wenxinia marina DSM 24838 TaxID=1123501 RepID=A0A0D0PAW2_9RHOB|nr:hypothetical protein [Wenxinia marina]KIQ68591.1 hypothetical protein Wenmar_02862 [Wenxinia marina DSM 24838]GGL67157.1 hypothetical protein GCM10011392_22050 [Wenxinia marina]